MSDEENSVPSPEQDQFKNLKAEMDRKLDNLAAQNAQLQQFLASLNQPAPAAQAPTKKVSVFEDEEAYAKRVADETEARIMKRLDSQAAETNKKQAQIQNLVNDYPELSDSNSEMARKAVEIYNSMTAEEQNSTTAYRAAVKEAAADLGLKPKAKRTTGDDGFTLGGGGTTPRAPKKETLNPDLVDLAAKFGVKLTPEVKERLSKKHGRNSYNSWE
jgi:hypothetical protein